MRKGQNPAKAGVKAHPPAPLGIATLVYIPVQQGYYERALEIFKIHLASVRQYTPEDFDYWVFDNGSCPEVKRELEKLHEAGQITTLMLSEYNLGKTGALNQMLAAMPNEWICFADSDMLFRPGWLEACRKIDESFENCGMLGAQVVFPDWEADKGNTQFRQSTASGLVFSQEQAPDWVVTEYCRARGATPERTQFYREMRLDKVLNTRTGCAAYLGGNSHQQFLARQSVLRQILPLPSGLQLSREQDTYQDRRVDELGYLHLTTCEPYLYHMGNTIDPEIEAEIQRLPLEAAVGQGSRKAGHKNNLLWKMLVQLNRVSLGRRLLLRLYNNLYEIFSS